MQPQKHICQIPLQLTMAPAKIMERAQEAGRTAGMPSDWVPPTFSDALFEIIVSSGDPEGNGVQILPSSALGREDVLELRVHYSPGWNLGAICEDIRDLMNMPGDDVDEAIVLILTHPEPSIELGIEVLFIETPTSQHSILEEFRAAEHARTDI